VSAATAEVLMDIFSAVFIGVTWHRFPDPEIKARMGATIRLMCAATALTALAALILFACTKDGSRAGRIGALFFFLLIEGFGYVVSWAFFSSFLHLPDNM